jgi:hypothetical protein
MRPVTTERIAFAAAAMAAIALIVAIAALVRQPKCPQCAVPEAAPAPSAAPPSSPVPAPVPDLAPIPPPTPKPPPSPTERATKLLRLRDLVDYIGLALTFAADTYPRSLPAHASADHPVAWNWSGFVGPDEVGVDVLAWYRQSVDAAPALPAVDDAVRAYLGHLDAWMPRWTAQQRYFERGDYLDDDLAAGRAADAELRASLAEARRLLAALATAVDAVWAEEVAAVAARAPDSDLAALDRAWETCRPLVGRPGPATACRAAADALRARSIDAYELAFFLEALDVLGPRTDAGTRTFRGLHAAQMYRQLRPQMSEAQAEAPAR